MQNVKKSNSDLRLPDVILKGLRKGNFRKAASLIVLMGATLSLPATPAAMAQSPSHA